MRRMAFASRCRLADDVRCAVVEKDGLHLLARQVQRGSLIATEGDFRDVQILHSDLQACVGPAWSDSKMGM
jgi:hypothetical protein